MPTREAIFEQAVRRIGGKTGEITSGTTTTVVLGGLVGVSRDAATHKDDLLWMLGSADADQERAVSEWAPATGTATVASLSSAPDPEDPYILVPKGHYTLADWRSALNDMLVNTRRSAWYVTPTTDGLYYSLANLSAVRTREDVLAVYRRPHDLDDVDDGDFEAIDFTEATRRFPIRHRVIENAGNAYIEVARSVGSGQSLIVIVKEPYTTLTADSGESGTTECPESVAVPGLIYYLSKISRAGIDRERWDRLQGEYGRQYAVASRSLMQIPVPATTERVVNRGA